MLNIYTECVRVHVMLLAVEHETEALSVFECVRMYVCVRPSPSLLCVCVSAQTQRRRHAGQRNSDARVLEQDVMDA